MRRNAGSAKYALPPFSTVRLPETLRGADAAVSRSVPPTLIVPAISAFCAVTLPPAATVSTAPSATVSVPSASVKLTPLGIVTSLLTRKLPVPG